MVFLLPKYPAYVVIERVHSREEEYRREGGEGCWVTVREELHYARSLACMPRGVYGLAFCESWL